MPHLILKTFNCPSEPQKAGLVPSLVLLIEGCSGRMLRWQEQRSSFFLSRYNTALLQPPSVLTANNANDCALQKAKEKETNEERQEEKDRGRQEQMEMKVQVGRYLLSLPELGKFSEDDLHTYRGTNMVCFFFFFFCRREVVRRRIGSFVPGQSPLFLSS